MFDDLIKWASSPLGSAIVGGVAVALIVAIAARVSKNARKVIAAVFRWIFSIRITTSGRIRRRVDRLIAERQKHVVSASWVIGMPKDGATNQYILMNMANGSVTHAINVDSNSFGFTFLSGADWPTLQPGQEVRFAGHWDRMLHSPPSFMVTWTDDAGKRQQQFVPLYGAS